MTNIYNGNKMDVDQRFMQNYTASFSRIRGLFCSDNSNKDIAVEVSSSDEQLLVDFRLKGITLDKMIKSSLVNSVDPEFEGHPVYVRISSRTEEDHPTLFPTQ